MSLDRLKRRFALEVNYGFRTHAIPHIRNALQEMLLLPPSTPSEPAGPCLRPGILAQQVDGFAPGSLLDIVPQRWADMGLWVEVLRR